MPGASNECVGSYYRGKRDLLQRQKRPTTEAKESMPGASNECVGSVLHDDVGVASEIHKSQCPFVCTL